VAKVAWRQDLLDRERRRQEVERVEALAGPPDLPGLLVTVPQLGGEVGDELVGDHEAGRRERLHALEHGGEERVVVAFVLDRVRTLFEGDELQHRLPVRPRAQHEAEVRQAAHEQRVPGAHDVLGRRRHLGERDDEGRRRPPAVGAGVLGIQVVQHDLDVRPGFRDDVVPAVLHDRGQPVDEPLGARAARGTVDCDRARHHISGSCEPDRGGLDGLAHARDPLTANDRPQA
jgi:hypothetical protein